MNVPPELVAVGRSHMELAHELILVGAALGLLGIFAGLVSRRVGAPILLVFLVLGMLAGEDGPGGILFSDFYSAYLIGSVALAVILFDGGIRTPVAMLRMAVWPALALAVVGVAVTAVVVGVAVAWLAGVPLADGHAGSAPRSRQPMPPRSAPCCIVSAWRCPSGSPRCWRWNPD